MSEQRHLIPPYLLPYIAGGITWGMGACLLFWLDGNLDLANIAMLSLLICALAAMFLPWRVSFWLSVFSVVGFDWFFVPPRHTFAVSLQQHLLMLLVMLIVNLIVISLIATKRRQADIAARHAEEANFLRQWSDKLNSALEPELFKEEFRQLLEQITGRPVTVMILKGAMPQHPNWPQHPDCETVWVLGELGIEQQYALWHCLRNSQQLGRGTGFYEIFADVYLPLRTRGQAVGAVLISNFAVHEFATRVHLQAICDQFGNALERHRLQQEEIRSRSRAQEQLLRNNLLAAISHDYRTPLATIMGSASLLLQQNEKLDDVQRKELAQRILSEATGLTTITANMLQLARLDADSSIACDWQSVEEISGEQKRRWRHRGVGERLHVKVQSDLPLIWCDPILVGQLLENLIENALKYSPQDAPVNLIAEFKQEYFLFKVIDAGPGIAESLREKIFLPFQRGVAGQSTAAPPVAGAGVGLALCRAIAKAHHGEVDFHNIADGGVCFELRLPFRPLPDCSTSENSPRGNSVVSNGGGLQ